MKNIALVFIFLTLLMGSNDTNSSIKKVTKDKNTSIKKDTNSSKLEQNIQKEIEKEKKYKIEQKFYMGDDYNLTEHEIDPSSLDKIEAIEPEYDFEMLEF